MDGCSISEAAARTGFPPSTLRYYEDVGLVRPGRTAAGYRCYDDGHLERLAFIGRAKRFGLTLDEITELLGLLADDECAPVQDRLRELVDAKIADAERTTAELVAFTIELRRVEGALGTHTPDGPCDDTCGCTTDPMAGARRVALGPVPARARGDARPSDPPPVACTLPSDQVAGRLAEWHEAAASAVDRETTDAGTRLRFERGTDVGRLAALIAAEQACCRFLTFTLTVAVDEVLLDVHAPADARPLVDALVGAP